MCVWHMYVYVYGGYVYVCVCMYGRCVYDGCMCIYVFVL